MKVVNTVNVNMSTVHEIVNTVNVNMFTVGKIVSTELWQEP